MATRRAKKVMTQPIHVIFGNLEKKNRVQVWLHDQSSLRLEGVILGFDEYMNLTLDEAEELDLKNKSRKAVGRILLKGENIALIMEAGGADGGEGGAEQ